MNIDMNKHNNRERIDEIVGTQTAAVVKMINVRLRAHICKNVNYERSAEVQYLKTLFDASIRNSYEVS